MKIIRVHYQDVIEVVTAKREKSHVPDPIAIAIYENPLPTSISWFVLIQNIHQVKKVSIQRRRMTSTHSGLPKGPLKFCKTND